MMTRGHRASVRYRARRDAVHTGREALHRTETPGMDRRDYDWGQDWGRDLRALLLNEYTITPCSLFPVQTVTYPLSYTPMMPALPPWPRICIQQHAVPASRQTTGSRR
jgi:hypothetical protein